MSGHAGLLVSRIAFSHQYHRDGSLDHPKHMFKLMGKKIMTILFSYSFLLWTYHVFNGLKAGVGYKSYLTLVTLGPELCTLVLVWLITEEFVMYSME